MHDALKPNLLKTELPADEPLIIMTRTFDAPLDLLWTVWTQPEHVAYWWGPREDNRVVELDVRTGGKWRIVSSMGDGTEVVFFGTYLAVTPKTMIRNTFVVEGMFEEDDRFYEEHNFEERDGKVFYRSVSKLDSFEARQGVIDSGMEQGANASMAKVDELLRRLGGR
ncbi:SRPBCC domain-containing protein [Devosia beringensis]|uniref:SRPBCC domain-containing protein n=1 Tax=Devosia beringensis TaxID=2657486 RepID=UPI00186B5933|nr:SRPBCC domain-containing protein [Devosia beringensis]